MLTVRATGSINALKLPASMPPASKRVTLCADAAPIVTSSAAAAAETHFFFSPFMSSSFRERK
ncbi:MAG: hypothetical protein ACK515_23855 [bacterium]|jgi:hypothetical protein|nr:hypothetical protein [Betaproteobacteria bacterium]